MGVKVLFENDYIRKYIEILEYDEIIKKAILNHNRAKIEENLSEEELLFCKIIRDADKLDIFYTITDEAYTMSSFFWYKDFDCLEINSQILKQLENHELIHYDLIKNNADQIPIFFAYIYDFNFDNSIKIVIKEKYLDKYAKRIKENFSSQKVHSQTDYALNICHKYFQKYL